VAGNPLLELERAGTSWRPALKHLARHLLLEYFSEGQVDQTLSAEGLCYNDLARVLEQARSGDRGSVLRTIFPRMASEALLAAWLTDSTRDEALESKGAAGELRAMVSSRLGLPLPDTAPLAEVRDRTLRYVLVNEFRSDLKGAAPGTVAGIPTAPGADHLDRVRSIARQLRRDHADRYPPMADRVQAEFMICEAGIRPEELGVVDTFRCEEEILLKWCAALVAEGRLEEALRTVEERTDSFWTVQDLRRRAQWDLVRALAELGLEIRRVRSEMPRSSAEPRAWVLGYAGEAGWFQVDRLLREVEARVVALEDEPQCEEALGLTRRAYDDLLDEMAQGFTSSLATAGWSVAGVLPQAGIYDKVVSRAPGRTAWFLVDALRFEMGRELARLLPEALELQVQPAIASLPSITPVGMASLMPGANADFTLQVHKDQVVGCIGATTLGTASERSAYFKTRIPDVVDLTLGDLLKDSAKKLGTRLGQAPLVLVRSTEIDRSGESGDDFIARTIMDKMVPNLARAIRKLAQAGVEHFVVTADHGYLFSLRKEEDMRLDLPSGHTVEVHRRCWVGRDGTPPPGAIRATAAGLGYDSDLEFHFPKGAGVFRAGGGLSYHHGGPSLQELVIPVLSCRLPVQGTPPASAIAVALEGVPDQVTNRIFSIRLRVEADLFTEETVPVRVVLLCGHEQVGRAGMALGARFDPDTGVISVTPGTEAHVGMHLNVDNVPALKICVLDPTSDAVLAPPKEIPVRLGI